MIRELFIVFVGFSGGIAVGTGFVAFLSVIGIIPRLTQLTKTIEKIRAYEFAVILGAIFGCWISLRNTVFNLPSIFSVFIGLLAGIFIGMLAAALTEVLNVFPILAKRIGIQKKIVYLLMAIALGKVFGSLFHWIYFIE
ncbi:MULTISPECIES: stage V sporulation protein AB [unclassified Bacillus (in: firmicutes)]|uniref:stage V sporulation protein AB n=1 Tax=unclassified Bacillus (in: firmicutes) TaxID=185979 RepID=UPI000BF09CC4|nr:MULTISPECIES: stage V sporulation protein AB [unclassified Bacillus (in: firmicutes)]PEJ53703.1 stage V sporulation protein AB [Bacillus sp. AFS002410]PEK98123.1 stage V sporulation protein AB [Bacillus sp. AFS017336]